MICFAGGYHSACGPCGTISPPSARFNSRSSRKAKRIRNVNRASQFKAGRLSDDERKTSQGGKKGTAKGNVHRVVD